MNPNRATGDTDVTDRYIAANGNRNNPSQCNE
jgi:hypothetical protein